MKVQGASNGESAKQVIQASQALQAKGASRVGGDRDGDNDGTKSAQSAKQEATAKGNNVNVTA